MANIPKSLLRVPVYHTQTIEKYVSMS